MRGGAVRHEVCHSLLVESFGGREQGRDLFPRPHKIFQVRAHRQGRDSLVGISHTQPQPGQIGVAVCGSWNRSSEIWFASSIPRYPRSRIIQPLCRGRNRAYHNDKTNSVDHTGHYIPLLAEHGNSFCRPPRIMRIQSRCIFVISSIMRAFMPNRRTDPAQLAKQYLAAIIQSADDAIISKNLESIVTIWNPGAERIFGYTAKEMIGQSIRRIIPAELMSEEDDIIARIRRGERVDHFETRRLRKDGRALDVSLTISPIHDDDGQIIGASKIARDISGKKISEQRLTEALEDARKARQQAEVANRMKDEFLATVSHELRTPLTAIVGWIRMLRSGNLSPERAEQALEVIDRNTRSQAQLIEDLLDISRITMGKLRLDVRPVQPATVIHAAVESLTLAADARRVRIQTVLDSAAGPISGDFERLQQVVWNLLSNAIKFTPKGGRVQVVLERVNSP